MAKAKRKPRPPAILVASDLTKRFGASHALGPVDLEIAAGDMVALIGHNGSGKSTLMRLAAGLLDPSAGTVNIGGHPAGSIEARALISYVPDAPVLYDDLSVWEHLEYIACLNDVAGWAETSDDLLQRFGLTSRAHDLPSGFSRGLRQKTALVIGLVQGAQLLAIDEPFVGLDRAGRDALIGAVTERRARGETTLIATHDPDLVEQAHRCLVLQDGTVTHDGPLAGHELASRVG